MALRDAFRYLIPLVALACAFSAGCGDEATSEGADNEARPAKADVEQFLMQAGEEPGFMPVGSPQVDSRGESSGLPPAGLARLRRSGFVSTTFQPISGEDGTAGVTSVTLFKTDAGALAWMEYETSTKGIRDRGLKTKIRRFTVPGVPSARGWTGRDLHGNAIGHVFWVQGRCMLVIGNEGNRPFVEPLSIGAKAIYERTNGVCPS